VGRGGVFVWCCGEGDGGGGGSGGENGGSGNGGGARRTGEAAQASLEAMYDLSY
jgi:hypothetical protein